MSRAYLPFPRAALLALVAILAGCASPAVDARRLAEANASGICHVHRVPMERVRVLAGHHFLLAPPREVQEAEIGKFPFAHRPIFSPVFEWVEIFVCAQCGAAKAEWIRSHPNDPWTKVLEREMPANP